MSYKIPDFLLKPVSEETKRKADYERNLRKQYYEMFPGSRIDLHSIEEGLVPDEREWKRFYANMEDCIEKKRAMEELYPEWDIWDPESDDLI